jgi:dTDP-glucose 4,6-dehydratase
LLDFCRKVPGSLKHGGKILHFSTDEVFGPATSDEAFGEWDRFNPNNPYSASKAGAESLCSAYANTYGLPIVVTHCTNVFGERQHPEKFIPIAIRKILCGETIKIHADKTRTIATSRYYTYIDNVSSAVLFLLDRGRCLDGSDSAGKYNISGEREVSNFDLVKLIASVLNKQFTHEFVDYCPSRPKHDMRYSVDDSLLRSLGWSAEVSFEEGIKRVVKNTIESL